MRRGTPASSLEIDTKMGRDPSIWVGPGKKDPSGLINRKVCVAPSSGLSKKEKQSWCVERYKVPFCTT